MLLPRAPLFWSTTTVVVGMTDHTDPAAFEREFLNLVDEHKLGEIRHLVYNPSRWKPQVRGHLQSTEHDSDHRGVLKMGRDLETHALLLRGLKIVQIIFEPKCVLPSHYVLEARRGGTVSEKWNVMDPTRQWDSFVNMVTRARGDCWSIERSIGFVGLRFVPDGGVYCWIAARWQLVCERSC